MKKTKIVCSIGPASNEVPVMKEMVEAGMNVARINFSHATLEEREKAANSVREVRKLTGKVLRKDTILVTINAVNSEIGLKQPVEEIGKYLNENAHCFFHVDLTQAIGKIPINLENIDLAKEAINGCIGVPLR